eukprot:CAMPEP_0172593710 /NCGR_PEP_ID=MMETSP1068-20121228/12958_1 /TAXON_ID=35684 /ORGANISM="Pseudopedinella elastica, Strain CCMP716" /LENGTH=95 /DNA_ID=CAMNT_0013391357 /DNA_START=200 /DNA_END=487 /DNA_ORIENTATION=+
MGYWIMQFLKASFIAQDVYRWADKPWVFAGFLVATTRLTQVHEPRSLMMMMAIDVRGDHGCSNYTPTKTRVQTVPGLLFIRGGASKILVHLGCFV